MSLEFISCIFILATLALSSVRASCPVQNSDCQEFHTALKQKDLDRENSALSIYRIGMSTPAAQEPLVAFCSDDTIVKDCLTEYRNECDSVKPYFPGPSPTKDRIVETIQDKCVHSE